MNWLLNDPCLETQKDFLLKLTYSLGWRMCDLQILVEIIRSGCFAELVSSSFAIKHEFDAPDIDAGGRPSSSTSTLRCVSCEMLLTDSEGPPQFDETEFVMRNIVGQLEGECSFCHGKRLVQATVSFALNGMLNVCSLMVAGNCAMAFVDMFNCSYQHFARGLNNNMLVNPNPLWQSIAAYVHDHTQITTPVDPQLFPAAYFLYELVNFASSSFVLGNECHISVAQQLVDIATVKLTTQYASFLTELGNVKPSMTVHTERLQAAYLRFHAEYLLASAKMYRMVDEASGRRLQRLVSLLEFHNFSTEQLLFMWCLFEARADAPSAASEVTFGSDEDFQDRLRSVDFAKCLANLFGLQFNGYADRAQLFAAVARNEDATADNVKLLQTAMRYYYEYERNSSLCSLDVLTVIFLRRGYRERDRLVHMIHTHAQTDRLAQAERYYDKFLREADWSNANEVLSAKQIALINDLITHSPHYEHLAAFTRRLAINSPSPDRSCLCWPAVVSASPKSTKRQK